VCNLLFELTTGDFDDRLLLIDGWANKCGEGRRAGSARWL
jgi:hypothetical protein